MNRRIKQNVWGNWRGYNGRSFYHEFGTDEGAAWQWQKTGELPSGPEEPISDTVARIIKRANPEAVAASEIIITVEDDNYCVHVGQHLVACEKAKHDPDWAERVAAAIDMVQRAGGTVVKHELTKPT